jgi:hypothetical protein
VANSDNASLADAGLESLTGERSFEWATAGPASVIVISGRDKGITYRVNTACNP